ncbi:MAG: hypothetical protein K0R33_3602 [Mycobacterium sp.]|nr:hypothetical protein [Mycobacterium sp.]
MTVYLRNPLTVVWALLTAVTLVSWLTARDPGAAHVLNATVTVVVLVIAAVKSQLVIWYFMEVRHAPWWPAGEVAEDLLQWQRLALELAQPALHELQRLGMPGRHPQRLFHHQGPRQAGPDDRPDDGRNIAGIHPVPLQRRGHRHALVLAEALRVVADLGTEFLAVIGQTHEFHGQPGGLLVGAEQPDRPQRLRRQRRLQHHQSLFGAAAEHRQEQVVHGPEVVVHQLRLETGPLGDPARGDRGVTLVDHQCLRSVE